MGCNLARSKKLGGIRLPEVDRSMTKKSAGNLHRVNLFIDPFFQGDVNVEAVISIHIHCCSASRQRHQREWPELEFVNIKIQAHPTIRHENIRNPQARFSRPVYIEE